MMGPVEGACSSRCACASRTPATRMAADIAAMLGEARYEDGSPMTEQDLRDELVTLLTDGPTSSLISWAFERILRHPRAVRAPAGRGRCRRRRGALPRCCR